MASIDTIAGALLSEVQGFPHVGLSIAVTPDASQLWVNGYDACFFGAYSHAGCPFEPAGVVNVFWAASPELIRTLGITSRAILLITPLPDSSLVALGSGNVLLFVDTATFHVVQSIPIRASGSLAFTPDGRLPMPRRRTG